MNAPSRPIHPPLLASRGVAPEASRARSRQYERLVMIAAFACFLPYPALPIGNRSALQIGNLLSLVLCIPLIYQIGCVRPLRLYLIILAPLFISAYKVALGGSSGDDLDLCLKSLAVWSISGLALVATQVCCARYLPALLTGAALATLLHALVGLWQWAAFASDQFPLTWIYVNPSFLSVQDNARIIARYIQRPFGLFPEPSAMTSSLAPWVILFLALAGGLVRLPVWCGRRRMGLFSLAGVSGLALIIVSRSGHAAITLLALGVLLAVWLKRAKASWNTYAIIVVGLTIILPLVIWASFSALGNRVEGRYGMGNSSWDDRAASLRVGWTLMSDGGGLTALFGLGAGLSTPAIQYAARLEAVWSILLTYLYETGVVGAAALGWIGFELARRWRAARFNIVYAAMLFVWLIGITLTTSYNQLLPLWMTLGWLMVWPIDNNAGAPRRWWEMRA